MWAHSLFDRGRCLVIDSASEASCWSSVHIEDHVRRLLSLTLGLMLIKMAVFRVHHYGFGSLNQRNPLKLTFNRIERFCNLFRHFLLAC